MINIYDKYLLNKKEQNKIFTKQKGTVESS